MQVKANGPSLRSGYESGLDESDSFEFHLSSDHLIVRAARVNGSFVNALFQTLTQNFCCSPDTKLSLAMASMVLAGFNRLRT